MMKIQTKEALQKFKAECLTQTQKAQVQVLVGMSSCGIAAGSREVMAKFEEVCKQRNLSQVEIKQCGCIGYCYTEPTVGITRQDGTQMLLGPVRLEDVENVVDMHIANNLKESKYIIPTNIESC